MIYFLIIALLVINYHTFSYGLFLFKKEKNKLAGFGVFFLVLISLLVPALMLIFNY